MKQEKQSKYELSAQEAIDIVRSYPDSEGPECRIAGIITNQDEAMKFLEWLCSPEARAISQRIRAQQSQRNNRKTNRDTTGNEDQLSL